MAKRTKPDDDVTPLESGDDATPDAGTDEAADKIAALEMKLARLEQLLTAGGTAAVPPGYKLVKDGPSAEEAALARLEAQRIEIDRGAQARSQDAANREWPEGKHVYRCNLPDKNGHPELLIRANTLTDAKARYLAVCGVRSTEKDVIASEEAPVEDQVAAERQ